MTAEDDPDVDLTCLSKDIVEELESGELGNYIVDAKVYCLGAEIGSASLGGCIYADISTFMDHVGINHYSPDPGKIPEGKCGSYFSQMVREAIQEAREAMQRLKQIHIRKV